MEKITIHISVPEGTKGRLKELARTKKWSLTTYIADALEQLAWPDGTTPQPKTTLDPLVLSSTSDLTRAQKIAIAEQEDREYRAVQELIAQEKRDTEALNSTIPCQPCDTDTPQTRHTPDPPRSRVELKSV